VQAIYPNSIFKYIIFGNVAAQEARDAFGTTAQCSTIHAMAYQAIIKQRMYPLQSTIRSFLSWKDIPKSISIPWGDTPEVLELVSSYNDSGSTSFTSFIASYDEPFKQSSIEPAKQVLQAMLSGAMPSTHAFYLKLYHKGITNGTIQPTEVDILALDEAQDATPIMLDIFEHYPAKQKIMVGDSAQSLFDFMGCINGFEVYRNQGTTVHLSRSFRVSNLIAPGVQQFCQEQIDPDMEFIGMDYPANPTITTTGIITRTNSELVEQMIELNKHGKPYQLLSKAKANQLFQYPEFFMFISPNRKYYDHDMKVLQHDVDYYFANQSSLVKEYPTPTSFVIAQNEDNPNIKSAINLLNKFDRDEIIEAKANLDKHKATSNTILGTCHAFKGCSIDRAIITDGLNDSVADILDLPLNQRTKQDRVELLIHYVACTRARYELVNAKFIDILEPTNDIGSTVDQLFN